MQEKRTEVVSEGPKGEMSLLEHLDELRGVLIRCGICLMVGIGLVSAALPWFADILNWPLDLALGERREDILQGGLNTTGPMGVFSVILQVTFFGGFGLALPFMLFFAGKFVSPALTARERRLLVPATLCILLLFITGCAFSFGILVPSALKASLFFNDLFDYRILWRADSYYNMLIWMTLGVGLVFEFPLVLVLLIHLRILSCRQLCAYRRHSIAVFLLVAAVITPTTDPFTFLFLALPLYVLYEISILIGRRIEKRRPQASENV